MAETPVRKWGGGAEREGEARSSYVVASRAGSLLSVFVQPRAAKNEVVGFQGGALKIKVKAPPDKGRANAAVLDLVADLVGIPADSMELVSGRGSRHKRIAVPAKPQVVIGAVERVLSSRTPKNAAGGT